MANVYTLISVCQAAADALAVQTQQRLLLWNNWLQPLSADKPAGDDPGYDDDFQQMREEVNKITGADSDLICRLAEKLLTTVTKDIRVASYYAWARLHRDGESGLADGLELLAGLMQPTAGEVLLNGKPLPQTPNGVFSEPKLPQGPGRTLPRCWLLQCRRR